MTFVTTSRRAPQDVRRCAKELAFAAGCEYRTRGKSGLKDLNAIDETFFLFSWTGNNARLQIFVQMVEKLDMVITHLFVKEREDLFHKGLFISDRNLAEIIGAYVPVQYTPDNEHILSFDGRQKKRYHLTGTRNG